MGCAQSRIENEEAVARCKERRQWMKAAVTARNAFAAAHSAYAMSLRDTGAALSEFAHGEGVPPPPQPPPAAGAAEATAQGGVALDRLAPGGIGGVGVGGVSPTSVAVDAMLPPPPPIDSLPPAPTAASGVLSVASEDPPLQEHAPAPTDQGSRRAPRRLD
ncbi:hypothetical protein GUJ93_ZPchr0585g33749 [Zizania palustris]|uniref:DUF630 domain-containing protein n=1 Tax=Zizania palustris TaxID=103762 RepID=A0A8J5RC10_ZIZPA|nr:hypothetical protein GUJ93_ZPchr0585g33749 [Zizania palustris]